MTSLSAQSADAPRAPCILQPSAVRDGQCDSTPSVSAVRQLEDELDQTIKDLGFAAVHAKAAGNHGSARELTNRMMAAIRDRTPEHQERLAAQARARIDRDPCYFSAIGERDRDVPAGGQLG